MKNLMILFIFGLLSLAGCDNNKNASEDDSTMSDVQQMDTTMVNPDSVERLEQNAAELNNEIDQFVEEL